MRVTITIDEDLLEDLFEHRLPHSWQRVKKLRGNISVEPLQWP